MIVIPESAWAALLDEFARVVPGVERVAFLDGVREGTVGVVTTITIPNADLHPGYYDVSAEAMSRAGQHFRVHQLARLAQVHTHGGAGCHHSPRDDAKAYSLRDGAVSIVLSHHASTRPRPHDAVVHVRRGGMWVALTRAEATSVIRVVPSLLDFRNPRWIMSPAATKTTWPGAWRRLLHRVRWWWPSRSRAT